MRKHSVTVLLSECFYFHTDSSQGQNSSSLHIAWSDFLHLPTQATSLSKSQRTYLKGGSPTDE